LQPNFVHLMNYAPGDKIYCELGSGIITDYTAKDDLYTIRLDTCHSSEPTDAVLHIAGTKMDSFLSLHKPKNISPKSSSSNISTSSGATTTRITSLFKSFQVPSPKPHSTVKTASIAKKLKFSIGDRVKCQFGSGIVQHYRCEDDVYEVVLDWTLSNNSKSILYSRSSQLDHNVTHSTRFSTIISKTKKSLQTTGASAITGASVMKATASSGLFTVKAKLESAVKTTKK